MCVVGAAESMASDWSKAAFEGLPDGPFKDIFSQLLPPLACVVLNTMIGALW